MVEHAAAFDDLALVAVDELGDVCGPQEAMRSDGFDEVDIARRRHLQGTRGLGAGEAGCSGSYLCHVIIIRSQPPSKSSR
jgi:hypothetical protein